MEFRHNSRPERCTYNYLYSFCYGYVICGETLIFNVFIATNFRMPEQELRQHNTTHWDWPMYPKKLYKQQPNAIFCLLPSIIETIIWKFEQFRLFLHWKSTLNIKSVYYRKKHFSWRRSDVKMLFCYRKTRPHNLLQLRICPKLWQIIDSVWRYYAKCIYVIHLKGIGFALNS